MTFYPQPQNEIGPAAANDRTDGFRQSRQRNAQPMTQIHSQGKADASALPTPANCNRGPINLRLEENGLTPKLMAGAFELISALSCYGPTHRDRADLRAAAGLLGDVLNRLRNAERVAPRRVGGARA